jgi:hypothetical protein
LFEFVCKLPADKILIAPRRFHAAATEHGACQARSELPNLSNPSNL